MNVYRRNLLVGATVLGGLIILGFMVLEFSSKATQIISPPQIALGFESTRADGLYNGSPVNYLGVGVGRVVGVRRRPDGTGVQIDALIDRDPPLPANLHAIIAQINPIGGGSSLNMDFIGDKPQGTLQPGTVLQATYVGLQFLPSNLSEVTTNVAAMSEEVRKLSQQMRESGLVKDMDETVKSIHAAADGVQAIVNDPKNRENIIQALADIRATTEEANKLSVKLDHIADNLDQTSQNADAAIGEARKHLDDLSKQIGDRLSEASAVMITVQNIAQKLDKGQGTAGALVNDPRLYEAMVASAQELNGTVKDLHRLVDQWEQEGVSMHLK